MYNPISTYRIQFHKNFTFKDLENQITYLSRLGIRTIYASPIFTTPPGCMHGYDITDAQHINPELGSLDDLTLLHEKLKADNIGWMQDIVPNHMVFDQNNAWLMDVLEKGEKSVYATYFDINFDHPEFQGKLMAPFLIRSLEETIEGGELKLTVCDDKLYFTYHDFQFPLNKESISLVHKNHILPPYSAVKLEPFNADHSLLNNLLNQQHYYLSNWKDADNRINYRRFITINKLICLQMDNHKVFEEYHRLIAYFVAIGQINGLRVDHLDGLKDPTAYIDDLRVLTGDETYIVVEKILEKGEILKQGWPLQGTTGYDFLAIVNNIFTYSKKYKNLQKYYREITGIDTDPNHVTYEKKKITLTKYMAGDWENLYHLFLEGSFLEENNPDITNESMKEALGEFLLAFDRYKLYSNHFPLENDDKEQLKDIFLKAIKRSPWLTESLDALQDILMDQSKFDEYKKNAALNFFQRCMQLSGPLMAKGVEDMMMHFYNCFITHNELGDTTHASGMSIQEFHETMIIRQKESPMTLNATSTHDTKRGEDVRARLNVISEISETWINETDLWLDINKKSKKLMNGNVVPDTNEEYLIYQTLMGIYPFEEEIGENFHKRLDTYLVKALREANVHSNWYKPKENYEQAVIDFVHIILQPESAFLKSFLPLFQHISTIGITNSLSQVVLKTTCPGCPDFYQGTELWDLTLADHDNRKSVDYHLHDTLLQQLIAAQLSDPDSFFSNIYQNRRDGRLKLWLTHVLMKMRSQDAECFVNASYLPLLVTGKYNEHILAFARIYQHRWYLSVIPLFPGILYARNKNTDSIEWSNTIIHLPEFAPTTWTDKISGNHFSSDRNLYVAEILKSLCPAVLHGIKQENPRKAGILLHISSLPGKYGIGDIGPAATDFIHYLQNCGQQFWQILPINPTEQGCDNSPYSSNSAFAGNLKLISPDRLVEWRMLSSENLYSSKFTETSRVDFKKAEEFRYTILNTAYSHYKTHASHYLKNKFTQFCEREYYWLNDYVLYLLLKQEFKSKPWYMWPKGIRDRYSESLEKYQKKYQDRIEKEKFFQFLFAEQWKHIRLTANIHGIRIIGDIPFYVSHDSADVWQYPQFFKLTDEKKMQKVSGIPPDYFNDNGQLWNMPVYHWDAMQEDHFGWWRNRIRKNMEYFDIIRFDHFRGFSAAWEVPQGEKTAVNGEWTKAPGHALFKLVTLDFPSLPFIAEDLGEIDEDVYRLRNELGFPGMSVLQFAFGRDLPTSVHAPHNFSGKDIIYTGTLNNNTIRGWFKNELSKTFRKTADEYFNRTLREASIHEDFVRMAYSSVAQTAIIPMQDILGLDETSRFNNPSNPKGNWTWKLKTKDLIGEEQEKIKRWMWLYGRL